jgi:hypothetical protein
LREVKGGLGFYWVSACGRVFSTKRNQVRELKPHNRGKYDSFEMCVGSGGNSKGGTSQIKKVHRVVYECFVGDIPEGLVIDHIDGNRWNNGVENLRAVTWSENTNNPATKRPTVKVRVVATKGDESIEFESIAAMLNSTRPYKLYGWTIEKVKLEEV